ncbi:MAG: IMP dehydrogenase [archaeon]
MSSSNFRQNNRLRVLFAVNTRPNESYERLERGFAAGADGVVVDVSQGYDKHEEAMLKYIVKKYPEKLLIGGNISTKEAAAFLAGLGGVDAYRNGQGPGSSCLTEKVIGASRAAATGVYDCAKALRGSSLKTIADGSLAWTGSIFKALSLGAHACMLGNMLAATEEGPGEIKFNKYGDPVKDYWGMGSERAGVGARRNYSRMPEGGEKQVPFKGSLHTYLPKIKSALIHAFEVKNMRSIEELHEATYSNKLRFERFMGTPNGSLAEL